MVKDVFYALLVLYPFVGIILWILGVNLIGGKKMYKEYLKNERNLSPNVYYLAFIIFIIVWPLMLKSGKGEE
jgi:hypothetical protein